MAFKASTPATQEPPKLTPEELAQKREIQRKEVLRKLYSVRAISKSDLLAGRNGVEKMRSIFDEEKSNTPINVMKFGKHAGKTYQWIKSNDAGYWYWAINNIDDFARKAESLGLN